MATFNSSVSDRKFTQINIDKSESQVDVEGVYTFTINNDGVIPTGTIVVELSSLKIGDSGTEVASDKKQNLGRVKPLGSQEVKFEFSYSTSSSGLPGIIESVCKQDTSTIAASTSGRIVGTIAAIDISSQGIYSISEANCTLDSESQPEPEPEPEPDPEPPEEDDEDGEDEDSGGQEQESEIQGPNVVQLEETNRYEWSDFPEEATRLNWVLLAEDDISEDDASLTIADDEAQSLLLDLVISITGDFLIITSAIADEEVIEQQEKVVSAVN